MKFHDNILCALQKGCTAGTKSKVCSPPLRIKYLPALIISLEALQNVAHACTAYDAHMHELLLQLTDGFGSILGAFDEMGAPRRS